MGSGCGTETGNGPQPPSKPDMPEELRTHRVSEKSRAWGQAHGFKEYRGSKGQKRSGESPNLKGKGPACLIWVTVKSFYLPHCLSKLLSISKRVEAVRVASFLNAHLILVPVKDAKVFAITSCGYIPPEFRFVHS